MAIIDRSNQVTLLLTKWCEGHNEVQDELIPIVYQELRKMARRQLRRQAQGNTLRTTELIHEAYLKLVPGEGQNWDNRNHFFGAAANAMRQILVDHARARLRKKRGGSAIRVELDESAVVAVNRSEEVVCLDDALKRLEFIDSRKSKVVELKFFAGMNVEEIAQILEISAATVKRDWQFARAWLLRDLEAS